MSELAYSTVLRDVSESLRRLITANIPDVTVLFESPGEFKSSRDRRILVYLYQATEFTPMRNEPAVLSPDLRPKAVASLYLELKYIVVPYGTPEAELVLVNQLFSLFRQNQALIGDLLVPGLRSAGNEEIDIDPAYLTYEQLHRVWELFPNTNYRLCLFFDLRPVRIPLPPKVQPTRTERIQIGFEPLEPAPAR